MKRDFHHADSEGSALISGIPVLDPHYTHLFGPVRSRRLGRSLGVDLVLTKTCSYDCVYCECGATACLTIKRENFFPVHTVIQELEDYLSSSPLLDFITFSGVGEPTLSLGIGTVIRFIAGRFPRYRIAVLTNGSLLTDPRVREDIFPADVVLPTFSTVNEETFNLIHRPVPGITAKSVLDGLVAFRSEYSGEIWLELFFIPGINTSKDEITGIRDVIPKISPDKIQINSLDRPGTEPWIHSLGRDELIRVISILDDARIEEAGSSSRFDSV